MNTETGEVLEDHIMWAKFTGASWKGDGFYYSAYDAPTDGKGLSAKNEFQKVYYHKLGTPQSSDHLEYVNKQHPLRFYQLGVSDDERFLFLYESDGEGNAMSRTQRNLMLNMCASPTTSQRTTRWFMPTKSVS